MKRSALLLAALVSLFALFSTSYASWACVEGPLNMKDYVVLVGQGTSQTATCEYERYRYVCCADVPRAASLTVYYPLVTGDVIKEAFNVVYGEENGLSITKLYNERRAFITLWGPSGTYLVKEVLPKEAVENAMAIDFEGYVFDYDPVIAWFVQLEENRPALLSYRVKRGAVPDTLPTVSLATCSFEIRPLEKRVFTDNERYFLNYRFEVLYKGERIVPSSRAINVFVGGRQASYTVDPKEKVIEVLVPLGKNPGAVTISIEVGRDACKATFSDTVEAVVSGPSYLPLLAVLGLVLLFLFYRALRPSS